MIITDIQTYLNEHPAPPRRIVSLVPSITELLVSLGREAELVGVTKFCVHPAHLRKDKTIIGGTKNLRISVIRDLQPDLIVANKEENMQDQVMALAEALPVWVSEVNSVAEAIQMIWHAGALTGTLPAAETLITGIQKRISRLTEYRPFTPHKTLYLIWREPWMSVGGDTFIHDMLRLAGLENVCGSKQRYPALDADAIRALQPTLGLLSSEPYPFGKQHVAEIQSLVPDAEVRLADGEYFSWYGSRMLPAMDYLETFASGHTGKQA